MTAKLSALNSRLIPILIALYVIALATSMAGMELFAALLLVFVTLDYALTKEETKIPLPPFALPLTTFTLIVLASIWLGDATYDQKIYDTGRTRFFLLYAVLFYALRRHSPQHQWLRPFFMVTFFIGLYGSVQHFMPLDLFRPEGKKIYMYAIPNEKIGPLVLGTFNHHLTFSNIYLFYAALTGALALSLKPTKKWLIALSVLLYTLCLWTQSRAAWFAVPVTVVTLLLPKGWKAITAAGLTLALLFATLFFTDSGFQERFTRTFLKTDAQYNLGPRRRLWQAQWQMFQDHPWIGIGFNNNERHAKKYVDKLYPDRTDNFYGHAHSMPLQILATTGILGTLTFLWLWAMIFRQTWKTYQRQTDPTEKALALGLIAGFIGFWLQGITQWNFGDAEVLHNVMFFWALSATLSQKSNTPSHTQP